MINKELLKLLIESLKKEYPALDDSKRQVVLEHVKGADAQISKLLEKVNEHPNVRR